jgi:hypothetical protein
MVFGRRCLCGCGRRLTGRRDRMFVDNSHRMRFERAGRVEVEEGARRSAHPSRSARPEKKVGQEPGEPVPEAGARC